VTVRATVRVCVCASVLSCTDPRARPVAPFVDLQFATPVSVTSPGTIEGLLYTFDSDGLQRIRETLHADDVLVIDSTFLLTGDQQLTRNLRFQIPRGLLIGTRLRIHATVTDFVNFVATDSVVFTVSDTLP